MIPVFIHFGEVIFVNEDPEDEDSSEDTLFIYEIVIIQTALTNSNLSSLSADLIHHYE